MTPWTVACQAPLSMGFSRQEYWSGLPCPSPGDLPDPGIKPASPALQASLPSEPPGKSVCVCVCVCVCVLSNCGARASLWWLLLVQSAGSRTLEDNLTTKYLKHLGSRQFCEPAQLLAFFPFLTCGRDS